MKRDQRLEQLSLDSSNAMLQFVSAVTVSECKTILNEGVG